MAAGRTFRPGPRAEYKQPPHRFNDDSLSTAEIASPLDTSYAPGGVRWQQTNRAATVCRPQLTAAYRQRPQRFTDDSLSTTAIASPLDVAYAPGGTYSRQLSATYRRNWSHEQYIRHQFNPDALFGSAVTGIIVTAQDDDTTAITGLFTDPAYGDGGIRAKVQSVAYRRNWTRQQYSRHPFILAVDEVTGAVTTTQDDDVTSITGVFVDPLYSDGGIRSRQASSVYRRLASRIPFTRRFIVPPVETYTAVIAVTQDDDVAAIIGQADLPYTGDSPTRTRAQSTVYRRLASRIPFTRHFLYLPADTTIVGTIDVTQDDDVASITGTFTDPPYTGDGGARVRAQSSVYQRIASRVPFRRRRLLAPTSAVTAVIAVTQDDDTTAIVGTFTDPLGAAIPGPAIGWREPNTLTGTDPAVQGTRDPAANTAADPKAQNTRDPNTWRN